MLFAFLFYCCDQWCRIHPKSNLNAHTWRYRCCISLSCDVLFAERCLNTNTAMSCTCVPSRLKYCEQWAALNSPECILQATAAAAAASASASAPRCSVIQRDFTLAERTGCQATSARMTFGVDWATDDAAVKAEASVKQDDVSAHEMADALGGHARHTKHRAQASSRGSKRPRCNDAPQAKQNGSTGAGAQRQGRAQDNAAGSSEQRKSSVNAGLSLRAQADAAKRGEKPGRPANSQSKPLVKTEAGIDTASCSHAVPHGAQQAEGMSGSTARHAQSGPVGGALHIKGEKRKKHKKAKQRSSDAGLGVTADALIDSAC